MVQFLKFCGYLGCMLLVVPLAGLCVTGSWKQALRYSYAWGRVMVIMLLAGGALFLVVQQFTPTP